MSPSQQLCLDSVPVGGSARVLGIRGQDVLAQRLQDLGFWPGTAVEVVCSAPFGGPVVYRLRGYRLALRRDEAARVQVGDLGSAP